MRGLKKCTIINLGTKQKPMKACTNQKKNKGVDKQGGYLADAPALVKNIKSPNVYKVPLKEEDHKSWLEFKRLDKEDMPTARTPVYHRGWPIKVDHPFVAVIRDFVTVAFNEVIHMYGKNRKNSTMSHSEVMSCRYKIRDNHYIFYMEMEAIEEGILGVYDIAVACDYMNGTTTLLQKILLDSAPKAVKKDIEIEIELERACKSMKKGKDNQKVAAKLINLKKKHKAIKGKCSLLYREIESQIPKGWSKRSDPRDIVSSSPSKGLIANRTGYNYFVCSPGFPLYKYIG